MIASIKGKVIGKNENSLIVEVGGVGLEVFVPKALQETVQTGEICALYTHLVVREDLLALYGFEHEEERRFFLLLLGVTGVGPRTALSILSTLSPEAIRRAVWAEQPDVFARVAGVGKRTGQKILLHLQDKIGKEVPFGEVPVLDVDTQVIEALTSLGYSVVEAQAALQSLPRNAPQDVEERLRMALRYFSG
jgi:Holliday junction DNA helicase RuvA